MHALQLTHPLLSIILGQHAGRCGSAYMSSSVHGPCEYFGKNLCPCLFRWVSKINGSVTSRLVHAWYSHSRGLNDCSFYTTVCFSEFRQLGKQKIMGVQIPWGGTHIIKRFPTWNSFKLTFFTKWSWIAGMSTELRHSVKTIRTKRLLFLQSHVVASACRYIHNVSAWQHILQMNLSYRKHHGRILGGPKSEVIDCTCLKSQDWFV